MIVSCQANHHFSLWASQTSAPPSTQATSSSQVSTAYHSAMITTTIQPSSDSSQPSSHHSGMPLLLSYLCRGRSIVSHHSSSKVSTTHHHSAVITATIKASSDHHHNHLAIHNELSMLGPYSQPSPRRWGWQEEKTTISHFTRGCSSSFLGWINLAYFTYLSLILLKSSFNSANLLYTFVAQVFAASLPRVYCCASSPTLSLKSRPDENDILLAIFFANLSISASDNCFLPASLLSISTRYEIIRKTCVRFANAKIMIRNDVYTYQITTTKLTHRRHLAKHPLGLLLLLLLATTLTTIAA